MLGLVPSASRLNSHCKGWRARAALLALVQLLFKQLVMEFCKGGAPKAEDVARDANGVPLWLNGKQLAARIGKSATWVIKLKKRLGEGFADAYAQFDPDGYRWKWSERKFSACDRAFEQLMTTAHRRSPTTIK